MQLITGRQSDRFEIPSRSRGVEFAPDSPLEGSGFEPPVPRFISKVSRCLIGPPANDRAEVHFLEVEVQTSSAKLVRSNLGQRADFSNIGRGDDGNLLTFIASCARACFTAE
jgi:hypothetical protein